MATTVELSNAAAIPSSIGCCSLGSSGCCSSGSQRRSSKEQDPRDGQAAGGDVITHDLVSEYYGKILPEQDDLPNSSCLTQGGQSEETSKLLQNIHPEILRRDYGCGSPIPPLLEGTVVLDLGCGTGRDVYTAAQMVGEGGKVIGVDMTEAQLAVARKHQEWQRAKFGHAQSNVEFRHAYIEDLKSAGIQDGSVDVVISNCVLNLAPDKEPVLREIQRVLKPGGELFFADVFADRRVPKELQRDKALFVECLSGALYLGDFRRLMAQVGLPAWGSVHVRPVTVSRPELAEVQFYSVTVRAVKGPRTEDVEGGLEDYGQVAVYKGTIPGHPDVFVLDGVRQFATEVATRVDSTTAAMLQASRYGRAFEILEAGAHRGPFTLWGAPLASQPGATCEGRA